MMTMMREMMEACCGEGGMPNVEKMKAFMEKRGKKEFTGDQIKMMREFCGQTGKPDPEKMKHLWKCAVSRSSTPESRASGLREGVA